MYATLYRSSVLIFVNFGHESPVQRSTDFLCPSTITSVSALAVKTEQNTVSQPYYNYSVYDKSCFAQLLALMFCYIVAVCSHLTVTLYARMARTRNICILNN